MNTDPIPPRAFASDAAFQRPPILPALNLREWFAGQALAGILAWPGGGNMGSKEVVEICVQLADALLFELAKPAPTLGGRTP